jgi:hypothetical protein
MRITEGMYPIKDKNSGVADKDQKISNLGWPVDQAGRLTREPFYLFCFGGCLQPEAILRCSSVLDCAVNFRAPLSSSVVQERSEYVAVVE